MANKMFITGRLVKDPEVRYGGNNNTAVARYSIASQGSFKDADGNYKTAFIKCVSFGKTAETIEKYCKKGTKLIVIDGEFQNNNYENNGNKVYDYQIVVSRFEFAESRNDNAASGSSQGSSSSASGNSQPSNAGSSNDDFMDFSELDDEELPF